MYSSGYPPLNFLNIAIYPIFQLWGARKDFGAGISEALEAFSLYTVSLSGDRTLHGQPIRAPRQIAETLILSLTCVERLQGKGFRAILDAAARSIYNFCWGCAELALETLTLSGLPDEHPTGWVKPD